MWNYIEFEPIQHDISDFSKYIIISKCNNQKERIKEIGNSRKKDLAEERKSIKEVLNKNKETIEKMKIGSIIDLQNRDLTMRDMLSKIGEYEWGDIIVYKIKTINAIRDIRDSYKIYKFEVLDIFEEEDEFVSSLQVFAKAHYLINKIKYCFAWKKEKLSKIEKYLKTFNIYLENFKISDNPSFLDYLEYLFNNKMLKVSDNDCNFFIREMIKFNRFNFLNNYFLELEKNNIKITIHETDLKNLLIANYNNLKYICEKLEIKQENIYLKKIEVDDYDDELEVVYKKEFFNLDDIKKYLVLEENIKFSEVQNLGLGKDMIINNMKYTIHL
jgi:hypothetical protein